ncbi:MAG TPA: hypothetical protein PK523_07635, partial [Elusimicrobiales bacterium]|nr:hypothetical protein [Elusimicrobiales bacterium]
MELLRSVYEVAGFILLIALGVAALEGYFYYHFKFHDRPWFFWAGLAGFPLLVWLGFMAGGIAKPGLFAWLLAIEAAVLAFFRYAVKGRHSLA